MKIRDFGRSIYWSFPDSFTSYIEEIRSECESKNKIYRPYFNDTKSIYIHIPKVAGKSVSFALYGEDPRHHKINEFHKIDCVRFDQYFKFSFVRNPWDRLYSTYNYLKIRDKEYPYGRFSWINKYNTFESWVMDGIDRVQVDKYFFLNDQLSYLENENGELTLDFIGRFENLAKDFEIVSKRIDRNVALGHVGKGAWGKGAEGKCYRNEYSKEMMEKVGELYSRDLDAFKYDF